MEFRLSFPLLCTYTADILIFLQKVVSFVWTYLGLMFPSYGNQSIDLHWKLVDRLLYDGNIGIKFIEI